MTLGGRELPVHGGVPAKTELEKDGGATLPLGEMKASLTLHVSNCMKE